MDRGVHKTILCLRESVRALILPRVQFNDTANQKQQKKPGKVWKMAKSRKNTSQEPAANEINPNAIYTTADLCRIFGVKRTTIVRWRAERGLPLGGAPKGHITGRAILDWVENGKGCTAVQPATAAS